MKKINKTRNNKTRNNKTRNNKTQKRTFKEEDYNSGDGMLTSTWGPAMWHYLHTMSFNYPINPTEKDKKKYREFILNLRNVLPCKYCRMNLKKNYKVLPLKYSHMKSRETFSRYIYDLHEVVNTMLNKKSKLSYDDVRERYEHFRSRCTADEKGFIKVQKEKTGKTQKNKQESGCTVPLYGKKSKCIIKIVPQDIKEPTMQIDEKCIKKPIE